MSECKYCGFPIRDKDDDGRCDNCLGPVPEKPDASIVDRELEVKRKWSKSFQEATEAYSKSYTDEWDEATEEVEYSYTFTTKRAFMYALLTLGVILPAFFIYPMFFQNTAFGPPMVTEFQVHVIFYGKNGTDGTEFGGTVDFIAQIYRDNEFMESVTSINGKATCAVMYWVGEKIIIRADCLENGRWLPTEQTFIIPVAAEPGDTVALGSLFFFMNLTSQV